MNNRIQMFTVDVKLIAKWGSAGSENGQFIKPEDIVVDLKTANVFTIDMGNSLVHIFGIAGHELSLELVRCSLDSSNVNHCKNYNLLTRVL